MASKSSRKARKPAAPAAPEATPATAEVSAPSTARGKKPRSAAPAAPAKAKAPKAPGKAKAPAKAKKPAAAEVEDSAAAPEVAEDELGLPVVPPPPPPVAQEPMLVEVTPVEEAVAREFLDEATVAEEDEKAEALPEEEPEDVEPEEPEAVDAGAWAEAPAAPPSPPLTGALVLARQVVEHTLQSGAVGQLLGAARGMFRALKTGLGASGSRQVDDYGRDAELVHALEPVTGFLYERYWRVEVQGAEQLPAGPSILVANHSGALPFDGPILAQALARPRPDLPEARWLVEDQIFNAPFLGTLVNRVGAVRASPENALRLLSEGRPVIVFPEGAQGSGKPFGQRYQLKRLGRGGFAKLAVRAGVPLVPVAVVGAEEALPLLGKLPLRAFGLPDLPITPGPLPARWMIRFGAPISTEGLEPSAAEDSAEIQRLVEQTRHTLEDLIQGLLNERRSVFRG